MYEPTYFKNLKSGMIFVSVDDGDSIVNPLGKVFEDFNEDLYEEMDRDLADKLSEIQKTYISIKKKDDQNTVMFENDQRGSIPESMTSYKGCNITKQNLERLKNSEIVIVVAFRGYFILDVHQKTKNEIKLMVKAKLLEKMEMKWQKSVKYRVIYD